MSGQFLRVWYSVLASPEWRNLPADARCVLLDMWRRYNGKNGGPVAYSWVAGQRCLGTTETLAHRRRVKRAFDAIEKSGLATITQRGFLSPGGEKANLWCLAEPLTKR